MYCLKQFADKCHNLMLQYFLSELAIIQEKESVISRKVEACPQRMNQIKNNHTVCQEC